VRQRETIYARAQKVTAANLALLEAAMERCGDILGWVRPQGGMTAFPWLRHGGDGRELAKRLLTHGILVAPGDCFGKPEYIRIGFGASGERFGAAIERLLDVLTSPARRAAS
jgi:aspartate/methionine/tyrosine aminotransferase